MLHAEKREHATLEHWEPGDEAKQYRQLFQRLMSLCGCCTGHLVKVVIARCDATGAPQVHHWLTENMHGFVACRAKF